MVGQLPQINGKGEALAGAGGQGDLRAGPGVHHTQKKLTGAQAELTAAAQTPSDPAGYAVMDHQPLGRRLPARPEAVLAGQGKKGELDAGIELLPLLTRSVRRPGGGRLPAAALCVHALPSPQSGQAMDITCSMC